MAAAPPDGGIKGTVLPRGEAGYGLGKIGQTGFPVIQPHHHVIQCGKGLSHRRFGLGRGAGTSPRQIPAASLSLRRNISMGDGDPNAADGDHQHRAQDP